MPLCFFVFVSFFSDCATLAAEWSDEPHCVAEECDDETVFLQTRMQEIVSGLVHADAEKQAFATASFKIDHAELTDDGDAETRAAVPGASEAAPISPRNGSTLIADRSVRTIESFTVLVTSVAQAVDDVLHVGYPWKGRAQKITKGLSMLGIPESQAGVAFMCTLALAMLCVASCACGLVASLLNSPKQQQQQQPEQKNRMIDREHSGSVTKLGPPMRPQLPSTLPGKASAWPGDAWALRPNTSPGPPACDAASFAWPGPATAASPAFPMSHLSLQSGPGPPQSCMWSAPHSAVQSLPMHSAVQSVPISLGPSRASNACPPLCPELVVPDGSQVLFQVPSLLGQSLGEHQITDRAGEPILGLRLERQSPDMEMGALFDWKTGRPLGIWELRLSDLSCRIIRADGSPYAQLEEEAPGALGAHRAFRVTAAGVMRLRAQGRVHERSLTVASYAASVDRVMAAVVEPGSGGRGTDFYWLRIAPGVDAGLVALALSALDRMVGGSELAS